MGCCRSRALRIVRGLFVFVLGMARDDAGTQAAADEGASLSCEVALSFTRWHQFRTPRNKVKLDAAERSKGPPGPQGTLSRTSSWPPRKARVRPKVKEIQAVATLKQSFDNVKDLAVVPYFCRDPKGNAIGVHAVQDRLHPFNLGTHWMWFAMSQELLDKNSSGLSRPHLQPALDVVMRRNPGRKRESRPR